MLISCKGSLIKSLAVAFFNGLVTLALLLVAPLGLAAVITNSIAVFLTTLVVTMAFDLITVWLLKSSVNNFLDYPYQDFKMGAIQPRNSLEIQRRNYED